MEIIIKLAWLVLAIIHLTPSLVIFRPSLLTKLYNVPSDGVIELLLTHRGGLFLTVVIACLISIFHIESRRLAAIVVGISMISFLLLYVKAGMPVGELRKIAIADAIGLPFLFCVAAHAYGR